MVRGVERVRRRTWRNGESFGARGIVEGRLLRCCCCCCCCGEEWFLAGEVRDGVEKPVDGVGGVDSVSGGMAEEEDGVEVMTDRLTVARRRQEHQSGAPLLISTDVFFVDWRV